MVIMSRENGGYRTNNAPSNYFSLESAPDSFVEVNNSMDTGTQSLNSNNNGESQDNLATFYIYENLQAIDSSFEFHQATTSTELTGTIAR